MPDGYGKDGVELGSAGAEGLAERGNPPYIVKQH